jgi:hypothetical protein
MAQRMTESEQHAAFMDAFNLAKKRPETKIDLFKSYWRKNFPAFDIKLTDGEIESFVNSRKTIQCAAIDAFDWQLNNLK